MKKGFIKSLAAQLRIGHYIKNLLVFIPVIFSMMAHRTDLYLNIFITFLSFCFASSAVYSLNDITDRKHDMLHPVKKNRPVPSGKISVAAAWGICFFCSASAFILSLFAGWRIFALIIMYIILNITYSFKWKNVPILDVSCIAAGFFIRVSAGAYAIGVPVSGWLLLTIVVLSYFLGFGKRKNELAVMENSGGTLTRQVLNKYSMEFLNTAINIMMTLAIAFYALWSLDASTVARLHTDKISYSTVIVIIGVLRYYYVLEGSEHGDPTEIILKDKTIRYIVLGYIISIFLIIYIFGKDGLMSWIRG